MFSKAILVAFLSLSLTAPVFAAPAQGGFGFKGGNQNNNQEQCGTAVTTVTVTAAAAAATGKGGNNAANNGAAGNKASSSVITTSAATIATSVVKATATAAASGSKGGSGGSKGGSKGSTSSAAAATLVKGTSTSSASGAANTAAAAGGSGSCKGVDLQSCTTLDPSVIATGFANNGQDVPTAGQVASLTSNNNFINFCATVPNLPITNGQQIKTGSCNPAPMGIIAATTNIPSSKFVFPKNFGTVKANTAFTIQMAINNLETGHFVNANENYFSAPQQVNTAGNIQGHSHVVVEAISAVDSTTPTDPTKFAFFKGLNAAAQNGILTADVTDGLPAGTYRLASINTAANHQPVLVAIAQHGSTDDMIYFTVTADGNAASTGANNSTAAASTAAAAASSTAKVGGFKGGKQTGKGGNN